MLRHSRTCPRPRRRSRAGPRSSTCTSCRSGRSRADRPRSPATRSAGHATCRSTRRARVDLRVRPRLLVRRERPVGRRRPGDASSRSGCASTTSLPLKNARFTPASRAASMFARCAPDQYSSWPTDRKTLWFLMSAPRRSVSTPAEVADVVPVALQEAHHRVLGAEVEVAALLVVARGERPVVADLVGAPVGRALVEVRAAVRVVRLPRRVRGLEHHVGRAGVVADDERDVARRRRSPGRSAWRGTPRTPRSAGTAQLAETAQLPQSYSSGRRRRRRTPAGSGGRIADGSPTRSCARRAPPYQPGPVDVDV